MLETALGIMTIGAFALIGGAVYLLRIGRPKKQPTLMLILAAILLGNAAILSVPNERGVSPVKNELSD